MATAMTFRLNIIDDCKKLMSIVFNLCKDNPEYRYDINSQLIRSTLSIGSNISEGNQRKGNDRNHFLDIALGSLEESRFQLCCYPGYDVSAEIQDTYDKIRATIIRLKSSSPSQSQSPT